MSSMAIQSRKIVAVLAVCMLMSGCSKPESFLRNVTVGTAAGAGAGALAMVATGGCIGCGAAVGAAIGATLGVAFDALENKR